MTLHSLNEPEARAEAHIMLTELNLLGPKNGLPVFTFVYDTILASYLMTQADVHLELDTTMVFLAKLNPRVLAPGRSFDAVLAMIQEAVKSNAHSDLRDRPISGQLLFSCILPADLCLKFGHEEDGDPNLPPISIVDGRLTGALCKTTLMLLLNVITRTYGTRHGGNFHWNVQSLSNFFLSIRTCSLSLADFRVSQQAKDDLCTRAVRWADEQGQPLDPTSKAEEVLQSVLSEARNRAGKLALQELEQRPGRNDALAIVRSGTKGNNTTIVEVASVVGPQFVESQRLNTALPMFAPEELKHEFTLKTGFVTSNYANGLTPIEHYLCCIPGRANQTDTTQKTCNTGYFQRKLTKGMEGIAVAYDFTVRTAAGQMLSVCYSGDGFNPMAVLMTPLELLGKSVTDITREHNVHDDAATTRAFLSMLFKLRRTLIKFAVLVQSSNIEVEALGTIAPLAALALSSADLSGADPSDNNELSPAEIWAEVRQCLDQQVLPCHHAQVLPVAFLATVLEHFSPAKLRGTTRARLRGALRRMAAMHSRALVQPGTQLGTLAGQSVGEPTTQLTLKSSHTAGSQSKISLGVPRIREIINLSDTERMVTPSMEFYVSGSREDCERICARLQGTFFETFVTSTVVGTNVAALSADEQALSRTCRALFPAFSQSCVPFFTFRFMLNKHECTSRNLTPRVIAEKVQFGCFARSCAVAITVPATEVEQNDKEKDKAWYVRFDIPATDTTLQDIRKRQRKDQKLKRHEPGGDSLDFALQVLKMRLLKCAVICGSKLITGFQIFPAAVLQEDLALEHGLSSAAAKVSKFRVETTGSDFAFLLDQEDIEWGTATTNSIIEVYENLGVAAATKWIQKQFQDVLNSNDSMVHSRHILQVAQVMTQSGDVQAFTRFGVIKHLTSVLARSAFEVCVPSIMAGAIIAEKDPLQGITENVILGQLPPIGTANVQVRPCVPSLYDLWQLQRVFAANRKTIARRRVRYSRVILEEQDKELIARVLTGARVCLSRDSSDVASAESTNEAGSKEEVKTTGNGWAPRSVNWGNFDFDVVRRAKCRADLKASRGELRCLALREILRFAVPQ
jgi:DNA-directed RNA polymerase II subunit RPB1